MGMPYDTKPRGGIELGSAAYGKLNADGTRTAVPGLAIVVLGVPSRVDIVKVVVEQTEQSSSLSVDEGVGDSFTVDLYNNRQAADNEVVLDATGHPVGRKCFQVMPQLAGTSGLARYDAANTPGGCGYPFFNQDPNQQTAVTGVADRLQQNQRVLYVVIEGTDGDVFSMVIGTDSDIHGI
jgi:hypothetical protein